MIVIPGINGSDENHWQTYWQKTNPGAIRIEPASWDHPELEDWLAALDRAFEACKEPPLVLCHSLGCLLAAYWAGRHPLKYPVRGAFLVAPPDPENPNFPVEAPSFRQAPQGPLPFPSLVIASSDDPYAGLDEAGMLAMRWGSGFIHAGALGHINSNSGIGEWADGRHLFEAFRAGTMRF